MRYNPYCKNFITRVFDIETTGLEPATDRIISASFVDTSGGKLRQYFCEAPQEEELIIEQILEELSNTDIVISYNGNRFDLPFVLLRAKKHFIANELPIFWSIDLYHWLKHYWPMAERLESLSQKSVEYTLGLTENRTDKIGGGECISLYAEYVNWNCKEAKDKILLHNGDDVRQLARIAERLSFLPYHKIAFMNGFEVSKNLLAKGNRLLKKKLVTAAIAPKGAMPADIYTDAYRLQYDSKTGEISLDIFLQTRGDYKFIDLKTLPLKMDDFAPLNGFQSGYLILCDKDAVNYAECNALSAALLRLL